jgi:hypothetical protein
MATAIQNADGSPGNADATPDNTHPITTDTLGMTANEMINALNNMLMLCSVLDGTGGSGLNATIDHRGDAPSLVSIVS